MLDFYLAISINLLALLIHCLLFRRWLPRTVTRIGLLVFTVNLALLILDALSSQFYDSSSAPSWSLDGEHNIPAYYSTILFSSVALVALLVSLFAKRLNLYQRSYWLAIGLMYYFFSADELSQLHDQYIQISNFYIVWGVLLTIGTIAYWRAEREIGKRYLSMFLLGLALSALGGLFLDKVPICFPSLTSQPCIAINYYIEEILELAGNGIILVALLGYASESISTYPRQKLLGLALSLSLIWPVLPITGMFIDVILPVVDLQFRAQKISVQLNEAPVQVLGYWQNWVDFASKRKIQHYLFHRTDPAQFGSFGLSYAVLDQSTLEVVAKADHWSDRKTTLRTIQGIHRQSETLTIPATAAPRNRALWLALSFWYQDDDGAYHNYTIAESDQPLLSERQVILSEFVIPAAVDPASGASIAHFENGIELRQVEIPVETHLGELFQATFSWHAAHDATEDLSQFLHFIHEESGYFWNYDQPPLGMRLPTRLWYAGLTDQETWQFLLPPDLQPGHYQIFTGLYRNRDTERLTASDDDGNPFQDALIPLGAIQILPTQEDNDD